MTIRPIDLQVLIPKAAEVNRVSHTQEIQAQIQQQQFTTQLKQSIRSRQKRVLESDETEGQRIQYELGSRGRGRKEARNKSDKDDKVSDQGTLKEEVSSLSKHGLGGHIDIKT